MKNSLPEIKTPLPGPEAKKIVDLDHRLVSPSYGRDYPMVAKRGRGMMVEDVDGNVFLDFSAGIAVVSTGHCHPDVVRAIQKQAETLIHMSGTDFYYPILAQLAEKMAAIAPGNFPKRVYFGNSGTEAVEAAMKLARYHTRRHRFIAFYGCFHGRTFGSLSLTSSKSVQRNGFGPLLSGVSHVPYPNPYRCPSGNGASQCMCSCECTDFIEKRLFKTAVPPQEVAAIVVEPIQGEGGYVVAPTNFLRELRAVCDRHGILLVADEVQSGMGRTGKWWASDHAGIEPDIGGDPKLPIEARRLALAERFLRGSQHRVAEGDGSIGPNFTCVRAAIAEKARKGIQERQIRRSAIALKHSNDTAHELCVSGEAIGPSNGTK